MMTRYGSECEVSKETRSSECKERRGNEESDYAWKQEEKKYVEKTGASPININVVKEHE